MARLKSGATRRATNCSYLTSFSSCHCDVCLGKAMRAWSRYNDLCPSFPNTHPLLLNQLEWISVACIQRTPNWSICRMGISSRVWSGEGRSSAGCWPLGRQHWTIWHQEKVLGGRVKYRKTKASCELSAQSQMCVCAQMCVYTPCVCLYIAGICRKRGILEQNLSPKWDIE